MRKTIVWAIEVEGRVIEYVATKQQAQERRRATDLSRCETRCFKVSIPWTGRSRIEEAEILTWTIPRAQRRASQTMEHQIAEH